MHAERLTDGEERARLPEPWERRDDERQRQRASRTEGVDPRAERPESVAEA
jgi:hypothetical protein